MDVRKHEGQGDGWPPMEVNLEESKQNVKSVDVFAGKSFGVLGWG